MARTITEVLAEMGLWADVAAELRTREIKGYRQSACGCPVTNYLATEIPGGTFSTVPSAPESGWAGCVSEYDLKMAREQYPIPANVDVFVKEFDNGQYPDLALNDGPDVVHSLGEWVVAYSDRRSG